MSGAGVLLLGILTLGVLGGGGYLLARHTPDGPDDPLVRATERLYAELDGFPRYAVAVGFVSREQAATYFSKPENKPEITAALDFIHVNPAASDEEIREYLYALGYPTTPTQRLFGRSPEKVRMKESRRSMTRRERREIVREAIEEMEGNP